MHLALQNAETINRLVEQGELLLRTFHVEHEKDPAGVETEFVRGELIGWRSTLHTLYRDYAEDVVTRVVTRTHLTIPNGEVPGAVPLMPIEAILHEVEPLYDRQRASRDTGGARSVWVRAAKRKFRIVKRENNIPVLGVCEYCNAEFAADPETIGGPKDAHAHIQKQFIAHKCKRLDASKNAVPIMGEDCRGQFVS